MEAARFFKLLKKHRLTLIAIPVLIMATAFVLLRKQPDTFSSKATISAGILEGSQSMILGKDMLQETKVSQEFSNLIQMMQMKQVYDQVAYRLMIHDLTEETPYRKKSKLVGDLNTQALKHAVDVYERCYDSCKPLSLWDEDQKGLYLVIKSMGYDYQSLNKKIRVYRVENSDFVNVEFESDSPKLSAFVVNTLCQEFIQYYTRITKNNEYRAIEFLDTLLARKKEMYDTTTTRLRDYKIQNGVLNLEDQAKSLYSQLADIETRIETNEKDIQAKEGALANLNSRFTSSDKDYNDTLLSKLNRDIISAKQMLSSLNDEYIRRNFDPSIKIRIDSLQQALDFKIIQEADRTSVNPAMVKGNLISQKISLEVARDQAKNSVKTLKDEYNKLKARFIKLVPNEAVIQSYEGNITTERQEYLDLKSKYNQTNLSFNSSVQIKQIELAMPEPPLPSKRTLLVILSGAGSFIFCLLILFVVFYLDNTVTNAEELSTKSNAAVLGYLPLLTGGNAKTLDFSKLWDTNSPETREFKNLLRSLRFEVEEAMEGSKVLAVTSLHPGKGNSFVSLSLANAYMMVNKKVLLIDGNFTTPSITERTYTTVFLEDFLNNRIAAPEPAYRNDITVLGNRGNDLSLFEINNEATVKQKLNELKRIFDIIIIECPAVSTLNKCKEWVTVSERILGVFEANESLTSTNGQYLAYLQVKSGKFLGWVLNKYREDKNRKKREG